MKKTMRMTPDGTRDWLFEESRARRELEGRLSALFAQRGFSEVMTPGLEFYDVFAGAGAVIPPERMYKLCDNEGRLLVMRPDSTVPIARMAAARLRQSPMPVRLYYAQEVYRLHKGLCGRYDQEFQAGAELVGASGMRADLEMLQLAAEAMRRCAGAGVRFRVELGHVGFSGALLDALDTAEEMREEIRGYIEQKNMIALEEALAGVADGAAKEAVRRLPRLFGGEEVLAQAGTLPCGDGARAALDYLAALYRALCGLGLGEHILLDLGLPRQHAYYDGVIFHGYVEGTGEAVVTGGRYDALMRQFGLEWGAAGFGVNVDALAARLLARGEGAPPAVPAVLVHAAAGHEAAALREAARLTAAGTAAEYSVCEDIAQAREYAARRGIARVVEIGGGA